jgi:hypothetical protein
MSIFTLPSADTKRWVQSNRSRLYGNISKTKNITLDKPGYIQLSRSPRSTMDETVDADWNRIAATIYNPISSNYFVQTWSEPFALERQILANDAVQITATDHPNGGSQADAEWFTGKLAVTESNDLHYQDSSGGTWTDTNISLATTQNGQHPLSNFVSKAMLAVANINTVLLYSALTATPTLAATLTIGTDYMITSIKYHDQNLYIGTRHRYGGKAVMYIWNGEGTGAQGAYVVDANVIHDVVVWKQTIVCFTSRGVLEQYVGSGFRPLDALPGYYEKQVLTNDDNVSIYHNCLRASGENLYVAFGDVENIYEFLVDQPHGVWCYNEDSGLHHRYSFSIARTHKESDPAIDTTTDQVTVTRDIATGTEVWYEAGTANAALTAGTKYFVIRVSATRIRIATTRANAIAGTYIDFVTDGGLSEDWVFFPNTDYGSIMSDRPSALQTIDFTQQKPRYGTDVIWAADLYRRDMSNTLSSLGSVTAAVESRGYFETARFVSDQVADSTNNFVLRFLPLTNELDKIIVKYRVIDDMLQKIDVQNTDFWQISWTSATTFTTTQAQWADAEKGDEVNVLRGAAGGLLAHITNISESSGTYTVTIDESFADYVSGDKSTAIFKNWKKLTTISYGSTEARKGTFTKSIQQIGKWVEFKVELRGIGVTIEDLSFDGKTIFPIQRSS